MLWTVGSMRWEPPQVRANAGPLLTTQGKGWQGAFSGPETRTCLVSGMSRTKAEGQLYPGQPVSPDSGTETVHLPVGAILSPGGPSGIGANKNPKALGGFGQQ